MKSLKSGIGRPAPGACAHRRAPGGLAAVVTPLAAMAAAFTLLTGCGSQAQVPTGGTVSVAAGGAVQTSRDDALTAGDLPTAVESSFSYLANQPGTSVPVSFDLDGPWDFTAGPASSTLVMDIIDPRQAPSSDAFPGATFAVRSTWSTAPGRNEYNFQDKDASAWMSFGLLGSDGMPYPYSARVRVLNFPAAVGDAWTEKYNETGGGRSIAITAENKVLARNLLSVPDGAYEAWLLQNKVTATSNGVSVTTWDYIWLVPGVGRAAEIISQPGESDQVFSSAASFLRLNSHHSP